MVCIKPDSTVSNFFLRRVPLNRALLSRNVNGGLRVIQASGMDNSTLAELHLPAALLLPLIRSWKLTGSHRTSSEVLSERGKLYNDHKYTINRHQASPSLLIVICRYISASGVIPGVGKVIVSAPQVLPFFSSPPDNLWLLQQTAGTEPSLHMFRNSADAALWGEVRLKSASGPVKREQLQVCKFLSPAQGARTPRSGWLCNNNSPSTKHLLKVCLKATNSTKKYDFFYEGNLYQCVELIK